MAKTESFDITTGVDLQEVDNAVNQARKEIGTRFDFKNVVSEIDFDRHGPKLSLHAQDEFTLEAVWQVLQRNSVKSRSPPPDSVPSPAPPSHVSKSCGSITTILPIMAECLVPQYSAQNRWNSPVLVASNHNVV